MAQNRPLRRLMSIFGVVCTSSGACLAIKEVRSAHITAVQARYQVSLHRTPNISLQSTVDTTVARDAVSRKKRKFPYSL